MLRRWDIVRGEGDAWEMVVKTTADVGAGEQLLLSYGERCSDDFFLHYGTAFGHYGLEFGGWGWGGVHVRASLASLSLPNLHDPRPLPTLNCSVITTHPLISAAQPPMPTRS